MHSRIKWEFGQILILSDTYEKSMNVRHSEYWGFSINETLQKQTTFHLSSHVYTWCQIHTNFLSF